MDLSGVIFVMLAVAWAVYLIPKTLKQHDEVARTRSINRFSGAMRVLARREAVSSRDARLVVSPPQAPRASAAPVAEPLRTSAEREREDSGRLDASPSIIEATSLSVHLEPATSPRRVAARRTAARAAARRRRRILTGLLLLDVVVGALAVFAVVPAWSAAVPVALTLVYLALCRTQVRRETARDARVLTGGASTEAAQPAAPAEAPEGAPVLVEKVLVLDEDVHALLAEAQEDTIGIPVADLQAALAAPPNDEEPPAEGAGDGRLWDPLPVTLPTYVTKAKARRTVRTIELGEPGTWTSGRTAEDAEVAARSAESQAAAEGAESDGLDGTGRRVVGG